MYKEMIAAACLLFVCIVYISYAFYAHGVFKKFKTSVNETKESIIQENLSTLRDDDSSPRQKAESFKNLILEGYILRHTLYCEGGDYSDKVQAKKFTESLKKEGYVEKLMSIEA